VKRADEYEVPAMRHSRSHRAVVRLAAATLALAAGLALAASYTDLRQLAPVHGNPVAGAQKAVVCFTCHGATGAPIAPTFPRLAGQRLDYLYHRIASFQHARPADPYYSKSPMTALAAQLSDTDMRDIAAFFSQQLPTNAAGVPALPNAKEGEALFRQGDPVRGIPPCQGCHGPDATGPVVRTGQYAAWPSLRGQPGPYLIARLSSFRDGQPTDTSNTFIMAGVAHTLDDAAIQALAAWLSSLPVETGS
jgi:cytochrome c553